ncbi:MAG: hypothetical protein IKJ01_01975 [Lachnospiraceae bacterium]|nr:hypothetical protein [Lachnospiraceae bacterium]
MFTINTIQERLQAFGYEVKENDTFALTFCMEKVKTSILNEINWNEIPKELELIAVDRVVGEFLLSKKTFASNDLATINFDCAIKQMQIGDTNTVFAIESSQTPEQRLDTFIQYLLSYGKSEIYAFRRFRW